MYFNKQYYRPVKGGAVFHIGDTFYLYNEGDNTVMPVCQNPSCTHSDGGCMAHNLYGEMEGEYQLLAAGMNRDMFYALYSGEENGREKIVYQKFDLSGALKKSVSLDGYGSEKRLSISMGNRVYFDAAYSERPPQGDKVITHHCAAAFDLVKEAFTEPSEYAVSTRIISKDRSDEETSVFCGIFDNRAYLYYGRALYCYDSDTGVCTPELSAEESDAIMQACAERSGVKLSSLGNNLTYQSSDEENITYLSVGRYNWRYDRLTKELTPVESYRERAYYRYLNRFYCGGKWYLFKDFENDEGYWKHVACFAGESENYIFYLQRVPEGEKSNTLMRMTKSDLLNRNYENGEVVLAEILKY